MGYEMSISFRGEMNKITAITAAAIFLGKHKAQNARYRNYDQRGGQDCVHGAVVGAAYRFPDIHSLPAGFVIRGKQNSVINRCAHKDALHNQQSEIIHPASACAVDCHGRKYAITRRTALIRPGP